jgi:aryl-alcohol dehydrogenase-like predicted oxidoreductase
MLYRKLGASELEVSVIGLGALHFGSLLDERESIDIINNSIERGVNFIDTAPMYGQSLSEEIVGKALAGRRNKYIVGTKVGLVPIINSEGNFGVRPTRLTKAEINKSVESSLERLQTDYIDLLQLHAFDVTTEPEETFQALDELVSGGKVRHIGVSNYDYGQLKIMVKANRSADFPRICSMQSHYNILERRLEDVIVPFCRENSISTICYRALGRGIITNKYSRGVAPPPASRAASSPRIKKHLNDTNFGVLETINAFLATRPEISTSMLSIGWLVSRPSVASMVLGIRDASQLNENIRALGYRMSDGDLEELDALLRALGYLDYVKSNPETFFEV